MEGLIKALSSTGIPEDELKELRVAIAEDESKPLVPIVSEGRTGNWFVKLLGPAVNKTIDVGVDVVSSAVAKTIAAYSGMSI